MQEQLEMEKKNWILLISLYMDIINKGPFESRLPVVIYHNFST